MRIIDLNYHCHDPAFTPEKAWTDHYPAIGYADHFSDYGDLWLIKHFQAITTQQKDGNRISMPGSARKFWIPVETHQLVRSLKPDVVIVQGLVFPFQLLLLRKAIGPDVRIIVQHHGERPPGWWALLTRLATRRADAFLFTAPENAKPWKQKGLIPSRARIYPLLEASTTLHRTNKDAARRKTGITGFPAILWVGRMNANKDPLTMVRGFGSFLKRHPGARLYMIFQTTEMLPVVKGHIQRDALLREGVNLVGSVSHHEMNWWYSSAEFFASTSWNEGSGYSLIEAIASGCLPVVPNIPSFNRITGEGQVGFLFPSGDHEKLCECLIRAMGEDLQHNIAECLDHFNRVLSFQSIAKSLHAICTDIKNV
jgi:glycosyltransferase involved in cell wall biosynthesis